MASVNRVTLIGNLGRDPEMRYLPSGEAVATFSIATTEQWKRQVRWQAGNVPTGTALNSSAALRKSAVSI